MEKGSATEQQQQQQQGDDSSMQLLRAVRDEKFDEARKLLDFGADGDVSDYYGNTPLIIATSHGNLKMMRLLLAAKVNVDAVEGLHGRTALHLAASKGLVDCLAALLASNASVDVRNSRGETGLHKAAQHGRFECLELLLASDADVHAIDRVFRYTALHRACLVGNLECVKLLIVCGARVDALDEAGNSPLHLCALKGRVHCIKTLLENRADISIKNEAGLTALAIAKQTYHEDVCRVIERFGNSSKVKQLKGKPMNSWSTKDVTRWLEHVGVGQGVQQIFRHNDITGSLLLRLTDNVLKGELGLTSWGIRKKILDGIQQLKDSPGDVSSGRVTRVVTYDELEFAELLGVGNFAEVKRASWRGTDVAVKIIYRKKFHNHNEYELFKKEVGIISQLHHPNVVQFIGTCLTTDGNYCIVTEFCGGGSLRKLLHENCRALRRNNLRMRIVRDVCKAFVHLHKWKPPILHRDLTSSNLLLDRNWSCKVADFGLSRESYLERTLTGGFGAVAWLDPLVMKGEHYTTKSDVYSFGMVMYEMQTGDVPHKGHLPVKFANMVVQGHRPPLPPNTPQHWADLIQECWSDDARERPEFADILRRVEHFPSVEEPSTTITLDSNGTLMNVQDTDNNDNNGGKRDGEAKPVASSPSNFALGKFFQTDANGYVMENE